MNQAILEMLKKYEISTAESAENALKEVIQELALLGLHRANFFEKAAFYGGTALRILYGLPRYSGDLDFTLFRPDKNFSLAPYFSAIEKEMQAYGFQTEIERVDKTNASSIESAFIKSNTKIHFLKIESLKNFGLNIQGNTKLKIKFEVDTEPALNFKYETRYLIAPTNFPIISLQRPDLFAGKLHAILFRKWKSRIKGRDFYDYIWYLKNQTSVRLSYLREKAIQSGHCNDPDLQSREQLIDILKNRFANVDFENAKTDILPFIKDPDELTFWSAEFFNQITEKIQVV